MQIFSKLQRNSTNYVFIKLLFLSIAVLLNSSFIFFPLLVGFVVFCEDLIVISFYISLFSILHNIELLRAIEIFLWVLIYKFFVFSKIKDLINPTYQPVVSIFFIYLPFIFYGDLIYVLYNIVFDILLVRIFRCVQT